MDLACVLMGILFVGCSSPAVARAPADLVPATIASSTSIADRFRYAAEARENAGLGFGYVAAIRENGKTKVLASGKRSLEPTHSISEKDLLEIGSVSKQFTGILIHLAAVEEKLSVDQRIDEFFPILKGTDTGSITIRELGLHSAGLPSWPEGLPIKDYRNPWADLGKDKVLAALAKYRRKPIPAGQTTYTREYSNWGFVTLGILLEQIYGKNYKDLVENRVLKPLGMISSGVDRKTRKHGKWVPVVPPGLTLAGDATGPWDFESFAAATGGIESNAVDMGKFLAALENPPRGKLGEAISASMITGIGWDSLPGATPIWKNGATAAYTAIVLFDPSTKRGIYVGSDTSVLSDGLGVFALGFSNFDPLLTQAAATRVPSEDELSRLKGRYRNSKPADPNMPLKEIEIFESSGHLVARFNYGTEVDGSLLTPFNADDVWNVFDGIYNRDGLRILKSGIRLSTTAADGTTVKIELDKLPSNLQKFPALEK
jgi:CubicO group peptidase (beta-lactamase class C family)